MNSSQHYDVSLDTNRKLNVDVNWDVEKYRTETEAPRLWTLRKAFMEANKSELPEDRLVCLTNVFMNVEVYNSRYSSSVMNRVSELSKNIQDSLEKFRANKTSVKNVKFVAANELKGHGTEHIQDLHRKRKQIKQVGNEQPAKSGSPNIPDECHTPYGNLVLVEDPGQNVPPRQIITKSTTLCGLNCSLKVEREEEENEHQTNNIPGGAMTATVTIGAFEIAKFSSPNKKRAIGEAFHLALQNLQKVCYTIKLSEERGPTAVVNRDFTSSSQYEVTSDAILSTSGNVGAKMLLKMGWQGGGLGKDQQGTTDLVPTQGGMRRAGFGHASKGSTVDDMFKSNAKQCLQQFLSDITKQHLVFSNEFLEEERAYIHSIVNHFQLKSKSRGKDEERYLTVSKKIEPFSLVRKLLDCGGILDNYNLLPPTCSQATLGSTRGSFHCTNEVPYPVPTCKPSEEEIPVIELSD